MKKILFSVALILAMFMPLMVKAEDKVNVYVFVGRDCAYCARLEEYLNTIKEENTDTASIQDAMHFSGITEDWLLKGLFLIGNVRNVSKWGKVVYLIQDGQIVKVDQEQGFKLS